MKRKWCPYCQALFKKFEDIPSVIERAKDVFDEQVCDGAHTLDAWVEKQF